MNSRMQWVHKTCTIQTWKENENISDSNEDFQLLLEIFGKFERKGKDVEKQNINENNDSIVMAELGEGKISNKPTEDQFNEMPNIFDFVITNEMDPRNDTVEDPTQLHNNDH